MKEATLKSAVAQPIAQMIVDGQAYTVYIGKMESTLGDTIYWIGSSLGGDGKDTYFRSLGEAITYVRQNIQPGATMFEVEPF